MMKGKRGLGKASNVEAERAILSLLKALQHVVDHRKGNLGLVRLVRGGKNMTSLWDEISIIVD